MKWLGAALILFGILLSADHRHGAVPIAIGLFLVGYWYFVERESFSADTSCDWEEPQAELHESSTDLPPEEFQVFLLRVVALIEKGFSEREAAHVAQLAVQMKHNEERVLEYEVVFLKQRVPLKVALFKDDVSSVDIAFYTEEALSRRLDEQMDLHFSEVGQ